MLVEKTCGKYSEYAGAKTYCAVAFDWFELEKKRIKKIAQNGTEIGIAVNEPLMDGDILGEDEEAVYVVSLKTCDLIKINISTIEEMGRAGFELGNRHMSLEIGKDYIKTVYDEVTYEYLIKLGFNVEKVYEQFSHYIVCKGHSHGDEHHHTHEHSHETAKGVAQHEHHHEHHHHE